MILLKFSDVMVFFFVVAMNMVYKRKRGVVIEIWQIQRKLPGK